MRKKQIVCLLAIVASMLFSFVYFVVFSGLDKADTNDNSLIVVNEEQQEVLEGETTLYWIQMGVFTSESSYSELLKKFEDLNLESIVVNASSKQIIVVGCSTNEGELLNTLDVVINNDFEYMRKEMTFSDEEQLEMLSKKEYKTILEGYAY